MNQLTVQMLLTVGHSMTPNDTGRIKFLLFRFDQNINDSKWFATDCTLNIIGHGSTFSKMLVSAQANGFDLTEENVNR